MSTQILYHGFGIRGYRHVRMMNQGGRLVFRIEQPRELIRCPDCGSQRIHCHEVLSNVVFLRSVSSGGFLQDSVLEGTSFHDECDLFVAA